MFKITSVEVIGEQGDGTEDSPKRNVAFIHGVPLAARSDIEQAIESLGFTVEVSSTDLTEWQVSWPLSA